MVEFYYNNVNFCEGYYSPKLLATSPSNLKIMSVLFSCKLISLNIWVAKFKASIVLCFCVFVRCEHYEENFTFTHLNNLINDSKKSPETYKVPFWLFICLHILSVSSG